MELAPDSMAPEPLVPESMASEPLVSESMAPELLMPDSRMEIALEEMAPKVALEKTVQDVDLDSMTPQDVNLVSSAQEEFVPDSLPPESEPPPCDRVRKRLTATRKRKNG